MDNAHRRNIHAREACGEAGMDPSLPRRRETGLYGAAGIGASPTWGRSGKNCRCVSAYSAQRDAVSAAPRPPPSSAAGSRKDGQGPNRNRRRAALPPGPLVGLGTLRTGRIPLHRVAAHGGPGIVLARQDRGSAPCAARPRLIVEKLRIRIDDPRRVHRTGARGIGAACDLSRHPKDRAFRRAVTIRRETADKDRPGFAAGTQAGSRPAPLRVTVAGRPVRLTAIVHRLHHPLSFDAGGAVACDALRHRGAGQPVRRRPAERAQRRPQAPTQDRRRCQKPQIHPQRAWPRLPHA